MCSNFNVAISLHSCFLCCIIRYITLLLNLHLYVVSLHVFATKKWVWCTQYKSNLIIVVRCNPNNSLYNLLCCLLMFVRRTIVFVSNFLPNIMSIIYIWDYQKNIIYLHSIKMCMIAFPWKRLSQCVLLERKFPS